MKRGCFGGLINSRVGKINAFLLFSIVLIFALMSFYAYADIVITQSAPLNNAINSSRTINFTFTAVWNANDTPGNCSIWTNTTGTWAQNVVNNISGNVNPTAGRIFNSSSTLSGLNFTFALDNVIQWGVQCTNDTPTGNSNFSSNRTLTIDATRPRLTAVTPNATLATGALWVADPSGNFNASGNFSNFPITFRVNVSDNNTQTVWYILNASSTNIATWVAGTSIGQLENQTLNTNSSMSREFSGSPTSLVMDGYAINVSINFSSAWRGPGVHSVIFCANDTAGNRNCIGSFDFVIMGVNITDIENLFSNSFPQGVNGSNFGGLNITFGNGTEIPESTFFNPISGTSFGGITMKNFTFIFNFSKDAIIWIVGATIDEGKLGNASNTRVNNTPTTEVSSQVGTGYRSTMAWADISSFIPSSVSYQYGIIQVGGISYSKKMYCNGTSMSVPNCHKIDQCNSTVFTIYNSSIVIPPNDGCWLESGVVNGQSLTSGYTYLFVTKFSGGLGGSDFSQINVTLNSPLSNNINTTISSNVINFTLEDINSTGLNLTANFSINVTIFQAGTAKTFFSYVNSTSTNLSCITADVTSLQNTTSVTCNVTFAFSNGTYLINVTARDTSNNSNAVNVTVGSINITVDQIPPVVGYYNFTNSSTFNTTNATVGTSEVKSFDNTPGGSVTMGTTIFATTNWTDNLTQPFRAVLQFYNQSANSGVGAWQTLNETPLNGSGYTISNNGSWANFSFPIPVSRGEFEGRNVSFRVVANDTVGNANGTGFFSSSPVRNFTIQINDTLKPSLIINGTLATNGTNLTTTSVSVVGWAVNEQNALAEINISIDNNVADPNGCNFFVAKKGGTGSPADPNLNRNSSFATDSSSATCQLANGSHSVIVQARDTWGNVEKVFNNFSVNSGNVLLLFLNGTTSTTFPAANGTSVTSNTNLSFSALVGGTGILKNMTFTSSCNATGGTFTNNTGIRPFQGSSCEGASANRTVIVTAFDFAGDTVTNIFQFFVDNTAPTLTVQSPSDGASFANNNVTLNWSVQDSFGNISFTGFYLDDNAFVTSYANITTTTTGVVLNILNFSVTGQGITGTSFNDNRSFNFTPGTHKIKFTANDSLGNEVNSSIITFTVNGPVVFSNVNASIENYTNTVYDFAVSNVTVRFKTVLGYIDMNATPLNSTLDTTGLTMEIGWTLNGSINVSLTEMNASAVNWNATNIVPFINHTTIAAGLQGNWTNSIAANGFVMFNGSLGLFTNNNNNSYYGAVVFPINLSSNTSTTTAIGFWWFPNEADLTTKQNITQCNSAFTPTTTSPCWNYTSGGRTIIQVPHYGIVAAINDSLPPNITINTPIATQDISSFKPNITVTLDAVNCSMLINASWTEISMTKSGNICLGPETNLTNGTDQYNISFRAYDAYGNRKETSLLFSINDLTPQNISSITISSVSSTGATVTVVANESINMSINSTGSNALTATNYANSSGFAKSRNITLSSLSASTAYNLTVLTCDKAGNCMFNLTLGFTTSAKAAAAAAAAASSSAGGGAAGAVTASNEVASAARQWDSLPAGTTAVMTINKAEIAVTGVTVEVKNTVSNTEIKVASLSSNPIATPAAARVYQYLQLTKTNIADADASKVTINFKVPKSWLTSNGVKEDDVLLYRYSESKWNSLATTKTGDDANNVMYQSTTPGFSTFAVGSKEAAPAVTPTAPTAEVSAAPVAEAPKAPEAKPAAPSAKKPLSTTALAWIVVAIIVIVAGVGYFMWQKKKEKY